MTHHRSPGPAADEPAPTAPGIPVDAVDALGVAARAIAGEFDVERVLQLIVDNLRDLVGARYAALGIVDSSGRIERFITSGISPDERAAIGDLPRGRGLLGLIIREAQAFRIADIAADRHSTGFPPNHPPMGSFLGLPIRIGEDVIGNFYLTDKVGAAEFGEADQRLAELFALHAAIAIQNARLHARLQRLAAVDQRLRIGRELHDGIIQGLYAVALSLEDVPELMIEEPAEATARVDGAIDGLNLAIGEVRRFIVELGADPRDASSAGPAARIIGTASEPQPESTKP